MKRTLIIFILLLGCVEINAGCDSQVLSTLIYKQDSSASIIEKCKTYLNSYLTDDDALLIFRTGRVDILYELDKMDIPIDLIFSQHTNSLFFDAVIAPINSIKLLVYLKGKEFLIQDVVAQNDNTLLYTALETGKIDVISYVNNELKGLIDYYEPTHLFAVVRSENLTLIKDFLEKGIDPNIEDSDGITPLMVAAELGNNDLFKLLLEHGADCYKKNIYGDSACSILESNKPEKN